MHSRLRNLGAVCVACHEAVWPKSGVLASEQTTQMFETIFGAETFPQAGHGGTETLGRFDNQQETV